MEMVELPYFAVSPPSEIAVPGFPQISIGNLVEASCRVEPGGNLVRNCLIVNESVCVRRAHGLFIKTFGIEHAAVYACDFGTCQCNTVFKIRRAMLRPYFELFVVSR